LIKSRTCVSFVLAARWIVEDFACRAAIRNLVSTRTEQ